MSEDVTSGVHAPTSIDACTFQPLYKWRLLCNGTVYSNKLYTTNRAKNTLHVGVNLVLIERSYMEQRGDKLSGFSDRFWYR